MKTGLKSFTYYALIPLLASIPGFFLCLCSFSWTERNIAVVPLITVLIYILFRKKLDMALAAKVNGLILLVLLVCFTGMMIASDGNIESRLMSCFSYLILPFFPIMILMVLSGKHLQLYMTAMLTYMAALIVAASLAKTRLKKLVVPAIVSVVCITISVFLYQNRPSVKYGGHGFAYMRGYSSTDFTDYTVYAENSKLAELDHAPSLIIDRAEEMPVLDGAEACYPLYAALAKAVYKDIDQIELAALKSDNSDFNGRIVTFTNTLMGFDRLLEGENNSEKYGSRVDLFFGARPSRDQMAMAEEAGVELAITPIGQEAFVFFVEADNPVKGLSSEQLRAIYHGDITNWRELGGKNQEILAFQRPANSGSQTMMEYFMGDLPLKEPQTYERVDAMVGVIQEVAQYANEKGAIGYSFRYFLEELNQEKGVRMLSVDGVYPTLDNIENGSYPLTVPLCLVTRKHDPNPNVQKMIDFILSDDGQALVRKTGYAGIHE